MSGYSYERDSRLSMKGLHRIETSVPATTRDYDNGSDYMNTRPYSPISSPKGATTTTSHSASDRVQQSSRAHNRTVLHERLPNNGQYHHVDDMTHQSAHHELDHLDSHDVKYRTKTQMAQAHQESQELYRSGQDRAGLKTVKTRRIVKKTTTITRGENEKLEAPPVDDKAALREELRTRLESIKRELNNLEHRIDTMAPVGNDMHTLRKQLIEMEEFERKLSKVKHSIDEVETIGGDFLRQDSQLSEMLRECHEQLARIEDKATRRLKDIDNAMNRLDSADAAMTKFNIKMDAMRRELNDLERRLDAMAPVGKDIKTLQRQLAEMEDFDRRVEVARGHLEDIVELANDMIRQNLVAKPKVVLDQIAECQAQLARIEERAAKRAREIADALNRADASAGAMQKFNMRLDAIRKELDDLEHRLNSMAPVAKDVPTLRKQLAEMEDFNRRVDKVRQNLASVVEFGESLIAQNLVPDPRHLREQLKDCQDQLARIEARAARRLNDIMDALGRADAAEAAMRKFQLKLDAVKRELDELEHRIDHMAPVAKDLATLRGQLAEMEDFEKKVNKCRQHLEELTDLGEELIGQGLISNPRLLRDQVRECQQQLARIEAKAAKRLRDIQEAMRRAGDRDEAMRRFQLKLDAVKKELEELEHRIDNMAPVGKDLATLRAQLAEMEDFEKRMNKCARNLEDLADLGEDLIAEGVIEEPRLLRQQVKECRDQLARIQDKFAKRLRAIQEAMRRTEAMEEAMRKFQLKLDAVKRELDELEHRIDNMAPVGKDLATLRDQLAEMKDFEIRMNKCARNLEDLAELGEDLIRQNLIEEPRLLRQQVKECRDQLARIQDKFAKRLRAIEEAMRRTEAMEEAMRKFQLKLDAIHRELEELERQAAQWELPGRDMATLKRQMVEAQEFKKRCAKVRRLLTELTELAEQMIHERLVDNGNELRHDIQECEKRLARLEELGQQRENELQWAIDHLSEFLALHGDLDKFIGRAEEKLARMGPIGADLATVKQQMEELKALKREVEPRTTDVQRLNKLGNSLMEGTTSEGVRQIREPLNDINKRWNALIKALNVRQNDLEQALLRIGQFEQALQELLDWLAQLERRLEKIRVIHGDVEPIEAEMNKLRQLLADIEARQNTVESINRAGKKLMEEQRGSHQADGIRRKLEDMNRRWQELQSKAAKKRQGLEESLSVAKAYQRELADLMAWLTEVEQALAQGDKGVGALPDTCREQLARFMELHHEVETNRARVEAIVKRGEQLIRDATEGCATGLKKQVQQVKQRWQALQDRCQERKAKLEQALRNAEEFQARLQKFVDWLGEAERQQASQEPVSRLVERLVKQMEEHKEFRRLVELHRDELIQLEKRATQLRQVCVKHDAQILKQVMTSVTNRYQRLVSKMAERQRALEVAYKEAKQFADAYQDLWAWLEEAQSKLESQADITGDEGVEELRQMIARHKDYQRALDNKQSTYEAVMRMGKQLKEKAPAVDKPVIQDMLDRLRDKWNKLWNLAQERQRRLDEALQDALHASRKVPVTEQEIIEDEVQRQVAKCTCLHRYKVYHVGEGRYRFGESQKLRLVRILRSVVMVRVGGGWVSLEEFLMKNDPCRAKGRTNVELREQFVLPDGASQALASFKSKMARDPASVPPVGPVTKIREKTERSMPMTGSGAGRMAGSPSDYYSEEDGERARSRNQPCSPAWEY